MFFGLLEQKLFRKTKGRHLKFQGCTSLQMFLLHHYKDAQKFRKNSGNLEMMLQIQIDVSVTFDFSSVQHRKRLDMHLRRRFVSTWSRFGTIVGRLSSSKDHVAPQEKESQYDSFSHAQPSNQQPPYVK